MGIPAPPTKITPSSVAALQCQVEPDLRSQPRRMAANNAVSPALAHVDVFFFHRFSCTDSSILFLHLPPSGPRQSSCWTCWPLDEAGASSSHCHCPRPIQGSFFSLPHTETALWWPLQMGMEGGRRQGHNLDDRSSVTRTEARRFLIWWGKGMRATAVERSKAPWPQWPALDRLPLSGRGSSVLLPSGHRPRAAPSVVGACLRERTRGTAGAHQHHHTRTKKNRLSLLPWGPGGPSTHSLGPVRVSFLVPVQCPVRPQRAVCCVSPTCTPHRASRCFCFHAITTPAVRPAPRCLARLVPHLGHPSPSPSPVLAQRRNAHSRSLHQCMINLPISSLRCHPPSVPAQLGPVRSWPSASTLSLVFSLHPLASPRLEFSG